MTDVVTVGETMGLFRLQGLATTAAQAHVSVAGAEGNVAVGLARLGHRVQWVGTVGADAVGRRIRRTYAAEGVGTDFVRTDGAAPSGVLVSERRLGDLVRVDYHRRGSAGSRPSLDDVRDALALGPRIFHVTGITPALSDVAAETVDVALTAARAAGVLVSLDVNYRARLWSPGEAAAVLGPLAARADIVVADEEELALVAPSGSDPTEHARALLDAGVREVVVKQGASGAGVVTRDTVTHEPAHRVDVADTVGAGDAFVAGYLSGVLDDLPLTGRLTRGNTLGAFAVAAVGDWEGLPTRDELDLLDRPEGVVLR